MLTFAQSKVKNAVFLIVYTNNNKNIKLSQPKIQVNTEMILNELRTEGH